MMRYGKMLNFGEVIIAEVQYTDTFEIKTRPAVVLYEEFGNVVAAAITSNPKMKGISLSKEEGAVSDSVIKLNYIFTIKEDMIKKFLFRISKEKKELIKQYFLEKLA